MHHFPRGWWGLFHLPELGLQRGVVGGVAHKHLGGSKKRYPKAGVFHTFGTFHIIINHPSSGKGT